MSGALLAGWDVSSLALALHSPRHDAPRMDADQCVGAVDSIGVAADLNAARLPGWQHVVNDDRRSSGAGNIAKLLGSGEVSPAHVNRRQFGVIRPADRRDVRHAVR